MMLRPVVVPVDRLCASMSCMSWAVETPTVAVISMSDESGMKLEFALFMVAAGPSSVDKDIDDGPGPRKEVDDNGSHMKGNYDQYRRVNE